MVEPDYFAAALQNVDSVLHRLCRQDKMSLVVWTGPQETTDTGGNDNGAGNANGNGNGNGGQRQCE